MAGDFRLLVLKHIIPARNPLLGPRPCYDPRPLRSSLLKLFYQSLIVWPVIRDLVNLPESVEEVKTGDGRDGNSWRWLLSAREFHPVLRESSRYLCPLLTA